jgi:hypothetical protein
MKQTKPAQAMELRSLSPVFDGLAGGARNGHDAGPTNSRCLADREFAALALDARRSP